MNWKPLIASGSIAALAFAGIGLWKSLGGGPAKPKKNSEREADACGAGSDDAYEIVTEPMRNLPALDPPVLWPRDGMKMAAPSFWVIWETSEHSKCRLLASHRGLDWAEIGNTVGEVHYLLIDLAQFNSRVQFAVEFFEQGTEYRNIARNVSFGAGASFASREYKFRVSEPNEKFPMRINGREPSSLPQSAFMFPMFPLELSVYVVPGDGDELMFSVANPETIPENGCAGFVELLDAQAGTYDRVLIRLER